MNANTVKIAPRPPSLTDFYRDAKRSGLTAVFQRYDKAIQNWAEQVATTQQLPAEPTVLRTGTLLTARQRAATTSTQTSILPNAGWVAYDYGSRIGESSVTLRPSSRAIALEPIEYRVDWEQEGGLVGTWLSGSRFVWQNYVTSAGAVAPRTFLVSFRESGTVEGYRPAGGRLMPRFVLMPGDAIVLAGRTFDAITEAVVTVSKRIAPGQYVVWLESADPDDPTDKTLLHVSTVFAELV